jgi:nucleotide-binding universal stress UspA family protein
MVRLEDHWQPRIILIATDGSPAALDAVEVGVEIAAAERAEVVFLYVVPPADARLARLGPGAMLAPMRLEVDGGDAPLREAAEVARMHGVPCRLELWSGDVAHEIAEVASRDDADLVVIGSQRRTGLVSALIGRVSRSVVDKATCPVLIVRGVRHPTRFDAPVKASAGSTRSSRGSST